MRLVQTLQPGSSCRAPGAGVDDCKTYPVAYNAAGVLDGREAMPMRALFFERTDHALKRKSALVLDIIQGKTTVAEASRQYDPSPSEVEQWVDDGKRGMENALRANPRTCASSTSVSSRTFKRRMARRC